MYRAHFATHYSHLRPIGALDNHLVQIELVNRRTAVNVQKLCLGTRDWHFGKIPVNFKNRKRCFVCTSDLCCLHCAGVDFEVGDLAGEVLVMSPVALPNITL